MSNKLDSKKDSKFKLASVDDISGILVYPVDKIFGTDIKGSLNKYKWVIMVVCILCLLSILYGVYKTYFP